jgi:hypothetical protein
MSNNELSTNELKYLSTKMSKLFKAKDENIKDRNKFYVRAAEMPTNLSNPSKKQVIVFINDKDIEDFSHYTMDKEEFLKSHSQSIQSLSQAFESHSQLKEFLEKVRERPTNPSSELANTNNKSQKQGEKRGKSPKQNR